MSDGELPLGHATQGVELLKYIHTESGQTYGSCDIQHGIKIKSTSHKTKASHKVVGL